MPIEDINQYITELENAGELKRVKTQVDANLEIAEILKRTMYAISKFGSGGHGRKSELPPID